MKSKNIIRINESQLKQIISESVKKILKEYDSTKAGEAMWAAMNARNAAIGTPNYGKKDRQFRNFQNYYQEKFEKENQQHNPTMRGNSGILVFDDVLNDGANGHFTISPGGLDVALTYPNGGSREMSLSWEDLRNNPGMQKQICQLSDNNAQMVAKWWKMNHGWRNSVNDEGGQKWGGAGYNPEFWSRYRAL